ncbi:hypothetical protein EVJ58_g3323 [Rhodofomes roseus]|uniref:Uncharacterized protein n=1 Tax=Rhodofomes roseus TaxID=34475 RepID=A0A4Y9YLM7_9APHY|nr:hypothetical protein EVJ58_g3323 [Rhodofomes roseus]
MSEAQDMFRVSPWITYDPSPDARTETLARSNVHFSSMGGDVDMDAPQISTLREDNTPEPTPARTSKFRVKLLVNEGKRAGSHQSAAPRAHAKRGSDEDEDEDEEEEDQLIDDDDDELSKPPPPAPPRHSACTCSYSFNQRPRTSHEARTRQGSREGKGQRKRSTHCSSHLAHNEFFDPNIPGSSAFSLVLPPPIAAPAQTKKKAAAAKGTTAQRAIKKRPSKAAKGAAAAVIAPIPIPMHRDDAESIISEGYPVTAASSPLPHDERTPEPEMMMATSISGLGVEDGITFENVAFPQYPLPSKPFPVQPAPKIGTGFAPPLVLDKTKKPVRRWRQVNREVRGIAGGRWFTRSWVGEKESEFASQQNAASQAVALAAHSATERADREAASAAAMIAAGITLPPKLAGTSASVPPARATKPKATKGSDTPLSTVPPTPSRQGSAVPEIISAQVLRNPDMGQGAPSEVAAAVAPSA